MNEMTALQIQTRQQAARTPYASRSRRQERASLDWRLCGVMLLACVPLLASAQTQPWLFDVTFRGMSYQTNANGEVIKTPMSETTILQELAAPVGITDLSTLALVYNVNEGVFGDAITVVNPNSGAKLDKLWGFYFGSDLSLGRMAVTNEFGTMERRVDQLYTKQSQFAMGSAFITKRHIVDAQGNIRTTIDGDLHYLVLPQGTNPSPRLCIGTFTTTHPFRPRQ